MVVLVALLIGKATVVVFLAPARLAFILVVLTTLAFIMFLLVLLLEELVSLL